MQTCISCSEVNLYLNLLLKPCMITCFYWMPSMLTCPFVCVSWSSSTVLWRYICQPYKMFLIFLLRWCFSVYYLVIDACHFFVHWRLSYNKVAADCAGGLFYSLMKLALETPHDSASKSSWASYSLPNVYILFSFKELFFLVIGNLC